MVKVPVYGGRQVTARAEFQQGITVQATPSAFGADIGAGMQQLGRGLAQASEAAGRLQAFDDETRAKETETGFGSWLRERMYGDGGFMTLEGRNAVDARAGFEAEVEAKRKELGKGLSPGAVRLYDTASTSRSQSAFGQGIVHSANARKQWWGQASDARMTGFADDALVNYQNPEQFRKNVSAGLAELGQQGEMLGWDKSTLEQKQSAYMSSVYQSAALRFAQDDPLKAEQFIKDNEKFLDANARFGLREKLEPAIINAKADRNVGLIAGGVKSDDYKASVPDGPYRLPSGKGGAVPMADVMAATTGLNEGRDGAVISDFIKRSAGINIDPRVTPWCAAFVNAVLGTQGVKGTGSNLARSFLNFGQGTDNPQVGDIVVLSRGSDQNKGHVGFFRGFDAKGNILVFGGNQSNGVNVQAYGADKLLGFRTAGRVNSQTVGLPNYGPQGLAAIQAHLDGISDPRERQATQKRLNELYTSQAKAIEAQADQVVSSVATQIVQNPNVDLTKLPLDVQSVLGPAKMTTLMNYQEKVRSNGQPTTDDRTLFELQTRFADDPVGFGRMSADELFEYRDKLSDADWKRVNDWRQTGRTDQRKAMEEGANISTAMGYARTQFDAIHPKVGSGSSDAAKREARDKQEAAFQRALTDQMQTYISENKRQPTQADIQDMTNTLLFKITYQQPGKLWGSNQVEGRLYDVLNLPTGTKFDVALEITDVPVTSREHIRAQLQQQYPDKTITDEMVVQRYEDFKLGRPVDVSGPGAVIPVQTEGLLPAGVNQMDLLRGRSRGLTDNPNWQVPPRLD